MGRKSTANVPIFGGGWKLADLVLQYAEDLYHAEVTAISAFVVLSGEPPGPSVSGILTTILARRQNQSLRPPGP
jgi:hypothetical protein